VPSGPYEPNRGARVIDWARGLLDDVVPPANGSHRDAVHYGVRMVHWSPPSLTVPRSDCANPRRSSPVALGGTVGYLGGTAAPLSLLLRHHGLTIEIVIDRTSAVGSADVAGVSDVVIESAVTAIMDYEDSVATVDAHDKTDAYRSWLGLMKGDLAQAVTRSERTFTRSLNHDRTLIGPDGTPVVVRGDR
jgi:malate synthase